ncbi:MAG: hypothetical protein KKF74_05305 [Nanoarchaeota archaeon]|nr:hypothetical protein [Nanoarchaeota archaeon]
MHKTYNNKPLKFCFEGPRNLINYKIAKLIDLIDVPLGLYGKTVKIKERKDKKTFEGFSGTIGDIVKSSPSFPFLMQTINEQISELLNKEDKYKKIPSPFNNECQEEVRERSVYCIGEKGGPSHPAYPIHYKLEVLERPHQTEVNVLLQSNLAKEKINSNILFELRKKLFQDYGLIHLIS